MKINVDSLEKNQNADKGTQFSGKIEYRPSATFNNSMARGYQIDISGNVMDNKAYGGQGKTTEDVMEDAAQKNVALQHKYMAVMSNSMSREDFAKLQKEGYHPGKTQIETAVTVVDRIKATMAEAGVVIAGYNDNMDSKVLEKITGSAAYANAIDKSFTEKQVPFTEDNIRNTVKEAKKAEEIKELNDGTIKYMVSNHMEPTIDNVYKASFSAAGNETRQSRGYFADDMQGYYGKKADSFDWNNLQGQMEKVITNAGLEVNAETMEEAKWLVKEGVPLTEENLQLLDKCRNIELPKTLQEITDVIARTIAEGKEPKEALLTAEQDLLAQAAEITKAVENIESEAVEQVVNENIPLTIRNLVKAQNGLLGHSEEVFIQETGNLYNNPQNISESNQRKAVSLITAHRQLEEVRLAMTTNANLRLLKSGFSIETAELEQLVQRLKEQELAENQALFGKDTPEAVNQKAALYEETLAKAADIPNLPIAVIGKTLPFGSEYTLNFIHSAGVALQSTYQKANESYEALMTAPRTDLGDSIKTAFRNIDDMLSEMNMEASEENRKAVRILAYNQMFVNKENMESVKEALNTVQEAVDRLTPAATLQMIREGVNPLEMPVESLNEYLEQIAAETENETERYSKFLYKLEKNEEISASEKDAYIGIYRLLRQIEKGDGAAIGSLVGSGQEITLKNLLSAVRTRKHGSVDAKIGDDFGGLEQMITKGDSISDQIEGYFKAVQQINQDEQLENEYLEEQISDYRQLTKVSSNTIETLLEYGQPVTAETALAAEQLLQNAGATFRQLGLYAKETDSRNGAKPQKEKAFTELLNQAMEDVQESFTDKDSAVEAYQHFVNTAAEIIETAAENTEARYIDIKSMVTFGKQISVAGNLAKEEVYEVPLQINGEMTSIRLKILHWADKPAKVAAAFETAEYGKVTAEFTVKDEKVRGYIACDTGAGLEHLQSMETALNENIKAATGKETGISLIQGKETNVKETPHRNEDEPNVSTKELYNIAKAFITTLKE